ncbi:MAG: hypothetical protein QXG39_03970 [Candidatus Aenigmatarchaeota archaeon]
MIGLESLQFDFIVFGLGFIISELVTRNFPRLRLFIINGKKKIKIHHAYLGAIVAFFSALTGHITLFNLSLGTAVNDVVCHLREKIKNFFKKKSK